MIKFTSVSNPYRRNNNSITTLLNEFDASKISCVKVDKTGYRGPAQLQWSINEGIRRQGYSGVLECHMYNGDVLLMRSDSVDKTKIKRGRHK